MWCFQGSILGPLLSRIFVNDLINSAKVVDLVFFAEDTNPFCAGNNNLRQQAKHWAKVMVGFCK